MHDPIIHFNVSIYSCIASRCQSLTIHECEDLTHEMLVLPSYSYRNQPINSRSKSIDWFLYVGTLAFNGLTENYLNITVRENFTSI